MLELSGDAQERAKAFYMAIPTTAKSPWPPFESRLAAVLQIDERIHPARLFGLSTPCCNMVPNGVMEQLSLSSLVETVGIISIPSI